ncbi:sigma-54 interaction domain-containing protein [Bacillus massilinigeriensis]|uniref:sigma-54 interaction domain-containing protein n=1 Tax=Bacillus massilionigeriensis TaxID=1805475 RepID=UPI000AFE206F|nr:sigma 54-interacting transcriptional regulator [Bacillus massilionigeriensis]
MKEQLDDISKEVLTAILKGIDEGIHVVDTKGRTIYYNEVAATHDGMDVTEVIGKPVLEVFPSLDEETSTLLKVLQTKTALYNQAQSYLNVHGKMIETINTTIPLIVKGKLVGAMEIAKDYSRMKLLSERLLDLQKEVKQKKSNHPKARLRHTLDDLISVNPAFNLVKKEAFRLAKSDSSMLVFGESGTGKELFVQGVHHASNRSNGPFIAQNCAAIPETLLESILFGTSKGSYTGAVERPGIFELADGGTLFLDEIHAMPVELQAKLLRVLEDGIIRRVGSTKDISVDVRVIAAMNIHPMQALEEKKIRHDIFYRLNVFSFELLPLRKRKDDIVCLTNHFIEKFNGKLNKRVVRVNEGVHQMFMDYLWPGNVRELKHTIEYMMNVSDQTILIEDDLPNMFKGTILSRRKESNEVRVPLRKNIEQYEKSIIQEALEITEGNVLHTAKILQIPRQTLQYKLKKYSLSYAE